MGSMSFLMEDDQDCQLTDCRETRAEMTMDSISNSSSDESEPDDDTRSSTADEKDGKPHAPRTILTFDTTTPGPEEDFVSGPITTSTRYFKGTVLVPGTLQDMSMEEAAARGTAMWMHDWFMTAMKRRENQFARSGFPTDDTAKMEREERELHKFAHALADSKASHAASHGYELRCGREDERGRCPLTTSASLHEVTDEDGDGWEESDRYWANAVSTSKEDRPRLLELDEYKTWSETYEYPGTKT